ncbi:TetR/AcrR family transcriptional regulator [Pallidibacillus thermolactis]|uniref:TetR/AcrR family transcriptional regulator n=1 Tax=Pallidibacillus thermolactis TaxID=251051 RepID=UPI00156B5FD1|nr:TetR/AcrR family transcriptional regulator [Pallidibacillus thermolactis]MCU9600219.1 TetR/AcrR family transcriptional regulator [Pallidibacillus thermolactis subsp. kokeshiiformis]MED1673427.1 TetR/AcrR family transcriptional regulator [Pallidibacillus thermolactis subsp. kokeshiiformis]
MSEKQKVHANVKDEKLIQLRREQIVKGAISLFKEKGFHRTTTREIAKLAGFSIGTLYEYIRSKEDILYLVCDQIYDEVQEKIQNVLNLKQVTTETIRLGIAAYFRIMDEMQDEVLVLYQEAKSLSKDALPYVLKKELKMVALFEQLIKEYTHYIGIELQVHQIKLLAHNLFVQGQMWGFRRWALHKEYSLQQYTELQTEFFIQTLQSFAIANK